MKVKICGITDIESAKAAVQSGADAIGFVFAESKRRVDIKTAEMISKSLPPHVKKVGVFVNEVKEVMEEMATVCGLDYLQLHGDESEELSLSLSYPVIKAFGIESVNELEKALSYPCEFVLLDSPKGKYRGGNGTTFDWSLVKQVNFPQKLIVAGGLNQANVVEMINLVSPDMVDVSSGVETNGIKDSEKISRFIELVKSVKERTQ